MPWAGCHNYRGHRLGGTVISTRAAARRQLSLSSSPPPPPAALDFLVTDWPPTELVGLGQYIDREIRYEIHYPERDIGLHLARSLIVIQLRGIKESVASITKTTRVDRLVSLYHKTPTRSVRSSCQRSLRLTTRSQPLLLLCLFSNTLPLTWDVEGRLFDPPFGQFERPHHLMYHPVALSHS